MEWLGCPSDLRPPLTLYATALSDVLGEQLVGAYVHGSVARGCANAETSDVDTILVLKSPCTDETAEEIVALHVQSDSPLDAVFVTQCQLRHDGVPTPVEFVIKPTGERKPLLRRSSHRYFLLDRQDAHECSIALIGPPFQELAPRVPWSLVAGCLEDLLPHILPKFKNPALMLCRIAYAFAHRRLCSKRDAGQWAVGALGGRWRPLIQEALDGYAQGLRDDSGATEELRALEQRCREIIIETQDECPE
jgi:streptomycin 3"-adenylyltransferase